MDSCILTKHYKKNQPTSTFGFTMILPTYLLLLIRCILIYCKQTESNPELLVAKSDFDLTELKSQLLESQCELAYQEYTTIEGPIVLRSNPIEVIKDCSSSQSSQIDEEIVNKCRNYYSYDFILDPSLFTPITSITKNLTYWNKYCGICNLETELASFESWSPRFSCKTNDRRVLFNNSTFDSEGYSTERVYNMTMLSGRKSKKSDGGFRLITDSKHDAEYKCKIWPVLSNRFKPHVLNCRYNFSHYKVRLGLERTYKTNTNTGYQHLVKNSSAHTVESHCDYKNECWEECSTNQFLKASFSDSICDENGFYLTYEPASGIVWNQCSNLTSKRNTIYVCGPTEDECNKKIKILIAQSMDYVSMFLLIVYLAISTNKQNLRNLPKRVFYSYSLTLLAIYVNEYTLFYVELCLVRYYVFFYIWQSHSFWILITSYDLCRIVYSSLKVNKIEVKGQTPRYLVYCLICWGLPGIFLATLYPTLNNAQKSWSCPFVSGFENEMLCSSNPKLNEYSYYLEWITIVIFLVIVPCLLVLTCLFIFLSMRNQVRSNVNRSYILIMVKVSVIMGVHWTLLFYVVVFLNSSERLSIITEFISALHGSFVFLAFGMDKKTWNGFKEFLSKWFISGYRSTRST